MGCSQSTEDRTRIDQLSRDVQVKRSEIEELKAGLERSMAKANEANSAESQLGAAERENQALKEQLAGVIQQRDSLEASMQTLRGQLADLQAELDILTREKSDFAGEVATLKGQMNADATAKSDLNIQIATLQTELQAAKHKHSAFESSLALLTKEKEELLDRLAHLSQSLPSEEHESHKKGRDCLKMGSNARIGTTGLYYCGQRMKGENDVCGPLIGTNCKDCQKLDRESRQLPKGFLMNGQGRICRRGGNGRDWYCAAGVMQGVPGCDGYCGPTNGPNCPACQEMATLTENRYRKLL